MARLSSMCSFTPAFPPPPPPPPPSIHPKSTTLNLIKISSSGLQQQQHPTSFASCAASKSTGFSLNSIFKQCETCGGQGAIECPGCKGSGKNKKNGNIFERWKCYDCQGFGLKSCPTCGKGGLTPEQRGER